MRGCRAMARTIAKLKASGILIDGEGVVDGGMTKVLLQIFSGTVHRSDLLRVHPAQGR